MLPQRQNFAAVNGFRGWPKPPAINDSAFYHPHRHRLQVFRDPSKIPRVL
jgi:hypothetical protein